MIDQQNNSSYECPKCNSDLTKPESIIRAFYVKGEDTEVFALAHYLATPSDTLPAGTICIDTHEHVEMDAEIHPDNDKCCNCKADICAGTIKEYRTYLAEASKTGEPLQTYEQWR